MATLASWDTGTLPTTIGSGVSSVSGGGPSGLCDAIQFNQVASTASSVQLTFTAVTSVTIRAYLLMPASWASSSQRLIGGRLDGSNVAAAYTQAGSGAPGQVRLSGSNGGTTVTSSSNGMVALSTWYRFELQTNHSANTARLMVFPLASDTAIYDSGWQSGTYQASTARVDIGPNITSVTMPTMRAAAISVSDSIAAPIGRASWDSAPLDTPSVTLVGQTPASSLASSDGTATVTWPAVSGAASYTAHLADTLSPDQTDFTQVAEGVTSPYTFTGLAAGNKAYGIKAKAT